MSGVAEGSIGRGRTLVVVPTYNERENLPRMVPMVLASFPGVDILVVDDASPDGSGRLADELAEEWPGRLHVIHGEAKDGIGPAYLAGFRWALEAGYPLVAQMDADLSHPPERLGTMIEKAAGTDVSFVIGSRYVGGRVTVVNWPIGRLLISLFATAYARVITGLPASDATSGFTVFRREVLEAVDLDRIKAVGYAFQIELKLRAWRKGFRFSEVPIIFTERDHGESKMSGAIVREAAWTVWKLRFLQLIGRL